jgi:hypothetical protein
MPQGLFESDSSDIPCLKTRSWRWIHAAGRTKVTGLTFAFLIPLTLRRAPSETPGARAGRRLACIRIRGGQQAAFEGVSDGQQPSKLGPCQRVPVLPHDWQQLPAQTAGWCSGVVVLVVPEDQGGHKGVLVTRQRRASEAGDGSPVGRADDPGRAERPRPSPPRRGARSRSAPSSVTCPVLMRRDRRLRLTQMMAADGRAVQRCLRPS